MTIRNLLIEHINYQELPLSGIAPRHILAIEQAIRTAWNQLKRSASRGLLENGDEKHITIALQQELENIRLSGNGIFSESEFAKPIRGAEVMSYDGRHLEKRPDLTFYLKANRSGLSSSLSLYDGLFVECKLISPKIKVPRYAEDGIDRFVRGEYSWTMPHCLMLAYVRTGQTLPNALTEYFNRGSGINRIKYAVKTMPERCKLNRREPRTYFTVHSRNWNYPPPGNQPKDIEIRHLWLHVFPVSTA